MDFTNYLANRLVKATVGDVAWTTPNKVYLALYTEDPTKAGIGAGEVDQASSVPVLTQSVYILSFSSSAMFMSYVNVKLSLPASILNWSPDRTCLGLSNALK